MCICMRVSIYYVLYTLNSIHRMKDGRSSEVGKEIKHDKRGRRVK